ncbi:SPFH domain-containing protein [Clostridium sp. DSM 100503]|uniref:flotillin family protein n=1 Tax=Clostridium sp. DSM 100503 TaxID=2963282 RepID=UPI00214A2AA1|nr:SPFH domain-containing protein [Clostridium sp. DSM 100503]MCR1950913.1 SPFH domain-containing protein [Clostridium sp. DSM 100503]
MNIFLEKLLNALPIIIIVVIVLIVFLSFWRRVPADKAMVITGLRKRVLLGRGGLMIPVLETSSTISLENISMTTDVNEAPAKQGIFVNIVGTAVVKVKNDSENVLKAVEQFCSGGEKNTVNVIKTIVEQILEGKLRGIISTLTVEQINEDRASFEQRIEDDIRNELGSMGLVLISYTILKISTQGGYLENRAKPQIAAAKSEADIAEAERKRDTEIKTASATREGQKAKLEAETEIAQSERDKKIKLEAFRAEQDKAKANADVAYKLQEVENNSILAEQQAELAEKEALVVEKKLIAEVKKPADAKKYEVEVAAEAHKIQAIRQAEAEAEAIRVRAIAEADAKKIQAEADAIKAKGIAEAEAKDRLAEAMAKYGEAAIVEMVVNRLPDVMKEVASPLEQIDKLTVIDNGGSQGASKVAKIVTDVTANGFEVLKDITGVDLANLLNNFVNKKPNTTSNSENIDPKDTEENISDIVE